MATRSIQQGFQILGLQEQWALRGRSARRGEAPIQRHVNLAGLHRGDGRKGPLQGLVVAFHPSVEIGGGYVRESGENARSSRALRAWCTRLAS